MYHKDSVKKKVKYYQTLALSQIKQSWKLIINTKRWKQRYGAMAMEYLAC
jgi:hypothetical protein